MTSSFIANGAAFSSKDNTWTTPPDFFATLNKEFGFVLDAAALSTSALCPEWYGPDHSDPERRNAFSRDWRKDVNGRGAIFLNPPYGRTIGKWMAKADESAGGGKSLCALYRLGRIRRGGTTTATTTNSGSSVAVCGSVVLVLPHFPQQS